MNKLMYLLVAGTMFIFTACNSGVGDAAANDSAEEVAVCADDCQKSCCLGCKATVGDDVCLADHSCCAEHAEEAEATEGEEVAEEADAHEADAHEGHDHE